MDRNKRITIFLTAAAIFVVAVIGFAMYMTYGFTHGLAKVVTEIGGSNDSDMRDVFINENDYWACYDEASSGFHGIYFKFNDDGTSDRYGRDQKVFTGEGDVIIGPEQWSVGNDSILRWGNLDYHIITCNKSVIVLYAKGPLPRHKFLIKEFPDKFRKGAGQLEE